MKCEKNGKRLTQHNFPEFSCVEITRHISYHAKKHLITTHDDEL